MANVFNSASFNEPANESRAFISSVFSGLYINNLRKSNRVARYLRGEGYQVIEQIVMPKDGFNPVVWVKAIPGQMQALTFGGSHSWSTHSKTHQVSIHGCRVCWKEEQ